MKPEHLPEGQVNRAWTPPCATMMMAPEHTSQSERYLVLATKTLDDVGTHEPQPWPVLRLVHLHIGIIKERPKMKQESVHVPGRLRNSFYSEQFGTFRKLSDACDNL
ncbi:hypothetical protein NDU88_008163 [Pleurodeles waltl]|uniref:Uncharacterized protein n=1 Tax=Pleurodeles waltl TaxID=8319 RepID=A0AAV7N475_PLEWA|nr:hypothetical protein NDU88_008163 [Pleurodeles waltl]